MFGGERYNAEYASVAAYTQYTGSHREFLELLRAYYQNNGLYEILRAALYSIGAEAQEIRALRNPAFRVAEFYPARLWPGTLPKALPLDLEDDHPLVAPLRQIWTWSNWAIRKQLMARQMAVYGEAYLKVAAKYDAHKKPQSAYLQLIDPRFVVSIETDERDFLTYLRIDTPQSDAEVWYHTEIYDKETGTYATYRNQQGFGVDAKQLELIESSGLQERFGIDFIPCARAVFRDIGEERGCGAYALQLDKIDEANRQSTALHARLFRHNKPTWALLANAMDATGRPIPPPTLDDESNGEVEIGGEKIWRLPGMSRMESLIPKIDYAAALAVIESYMREIERDLPELAYYQLREMREISGVAAEALIGDAAARLIEVRGSAEAALIQAESMALTIAQNMQLSGFDAGAIGTYAGGDFTHTFRERAVIPLTPGQRAALLKTLTSSGVPVLTAMLIARYSAAEILAVEEERVSDRSAMLLSAAAYLTQERETQ
jgi:hypothetical protein